MTVKDFLTQITASVAPDDYDTGGSMALIKIGDYTMTDLQRAVCSTSFPSTSWMPSVFMD